MCMHVGIWGKRYWREGRTPIVSVFHNFASGPTILFVASIRSFVDVDVGEGPVVRETTAGGTVVAQHLSMEQAAEHEMRTHMSKGLCCDMALLFCNFRKHTPYALSEEAH